jgi:hypothetical protein
LRTELQQALSGVLDLIERVGCTLIEQKLIAE